VLYGSRARGNAREDSDYDVAVFLRDFVSRWQEIDRIIPIVTDILYENEAFIHAMPYRAGAYADRTPLMQEIRREGIDL
jgi:predicted nucleotidyltransferase